VLWGSFVSYTSDAKVKMLGIREELLADSGVVSENAAKAMALGALEKSGAFWAFSLTGFAGPDKQEPGQATTGTVWIGIAENSEEKGRLESEAKVFYFQGSRNEVREAAAIALLKEVIKKITM